MAIFERFEQWIFWAVTTLATSLVMAVGWLVRKVLTNEKVIELHEAEFKHRDKLREEDRERMARIEAGQDRILDALTGGEHGRNEN